MTNITRRTRIVEPIAFTGALMLILCLPAACDKADVRAAASQDRPAATEPADEHGHDHGKAADKGAPAADEHGHAHGDEHTDEVVLTPQAIRANGIRIATAKAQVLSATIVAPARVAYNAEQMAHVGSVVRGRVTELKVRVGDPVNRGDSLLVIDSAELGEAQSDYLQKRTAVEIAHPAVELAKSSYQRADELYNTNQGIALTEVQKRQGEYQAAQGALRSAEAALTAAENRLHLLGMSQQAVETLAKTGEIDPAYTVRAPIAGRVIEREVTLGELVGPDKERLLVLANLNPIWVVADVPEAKLSQAAVGANVSITVPAHGSESFTGKVSHIVPELDPQTRTARVRIEVPNETTKLLPGMFATAEITATADASAADAVVAVPEEAVQTVEGEPAVFVPVEGEPNTFAKRAVGIGPPMGGMVPVYAGLKEGEKYVATGSFILKAELGKAGAAHEH